MHINRELVKTIGLMQAIFIAFLFVNAWLVALVNGGTLTISINEFGEQWVEYLVFLLVWPLIVLAFHYEFVE